MGDEIVIIGDDGSEHVFPAGFDPKKAAAIVRGGASSETTMPKATAATGLALGAAKMAPGAVSLTNRATDVIGAMGSSPLAKMVTGSTLPKVAEYLKAPTAAAGTRLSPILDASGKAMSVATKAGPLMRGAGWLSRMAGKAALPLTLASGAYDTFNAIAEGAKLLEDPNRSEQEKAVIRLALSGGFSQ